MPEQQKQPQAPAALPGMVGPGTNPLDAIAAAALASSSPEMVQLVIEERRAQRRAAEASVLEQQRIKAQQDMEAARQEHEKALQQASEEAARARLETTETRQREEFATTEARQGREFAVVTRQKEKELGLKERELAASIAAQGAQEERLGREAVGKAIDDTLDFYRRLSAPTAAAGVKLDPKDILGALGAAGQAQMLAIMSDEKLDQTGKARAVAGLLGPVAQGTAAAIASATGGLTSPDRILQEASSVLTLQALRVPERFRKEFIDQLQLAVTPLDEARATVATGNVQAMTPEQTVAFTADTASKLSTAIREGHSLSRVEQDLFAKFWRGTEGVPAKAEVLEKTLALAVNGVAQVEGLDDVQTNALYESLYDSIVSIVDNEDARAVSDILVERERDPRIRQINSELVTLRERLDDIAKVKSDFTNVGDIEKARAETQSRIASLEKERLGLSQLRVRGGGAQTSDVRRAGGR